MGRAPCCEKMSVKKGPWSKEEDQILINYINENGHGNWRRIPKNAGLLRCGKSCRLRWVNYLRPDIKRGSFTREEEAIIVKLHKTLGNRWSTIASRLPGRTDNEIKNIWNTRLKKRLHEFDTPADDQVVPDSQGTLKNDNFLGILENDNFLGILENDDSPSNLEAEAENNDPATNLATGAPAASNNTSGSGSAGLAEIDFPVGDGDHQFWTQVNDTSEMSSSVRPEAENSGFEFNGADFNPTMDNYNNVGGVGPGNQQLWQDHLLTWSDCEFLDLWN